MSRRRHPMGCEIIISVDLVTRFRSKFAQAIPRSILLRYHRARWPLRKRKLVRRQQRHVLERSGGAVIAGGPFAGMQFISNTKWNPVPLYVSGAYESELHDVVEELISARPFTVVDVGCAEGYYAVGMARRLPEARIHAYDIDSAAQRACHALAALNDVEDRVSVSGRCTAADLERLAGADTVFIVDIEGAELDLLSVQVADAARDSSLLVELHDAVEPTTTSRLLERFRTTHAVELIDVQEPDLEAWSVLDGLTDYDRRMVLDEGRPTDPHPMQWAVMRPTHRKEQPGPRVGRDSESQRGGLSAG